MGQLPLLLRSVVGCCAFVAGIGAFSIWGPKFLVGQFPELGVATASSGFGGVLLVAGAIATFAGGWGTGRALRRLPAAAPGAPFDAIEHRVAINAMLRICALGMVLAAPAAAAAF